MPDGERWAEPDGRWLVGDLNAKMRTAVEMKRRCSLNNTEGWQEAQKVWDEVYPLWAKAFR